MQTLNSCLNFRLLGHINNMNNLKTNFGKRKIKVEKKTPLVQKLFSEISKKYDLMNDIMSFGTHRLWKKRLIEIMNINFNDKITKNKNAYKYLQESISQFPQQDIFLNEINSVGFKETNYTNIFDGIVSIHKGYKI